MGFVTLDNILNALLGQIRDEFHTPSPTIMYAKDGNILMKGNSPLYLLEKALSINLENVEAHTIGGLLLTHLERMPKVKEQVSFTYFDVLVLKVKGPKILLVKVVPKKPIV